MYQMHLPPQQQADASGQKSHGGAAGEITVTQYKKGRPVKTFVIPSPADKLLASGNKATFNRRTQP